MQLEQKEVHTVEVIILNYNTKALVEKLLPAVLQFTNHPWACVTVADNASTDGTVEMVTRQFPQVRRIVLEQNYGFAGGYNRAIAQSNAEYVVLLNSDAVPVNNWLEPMLETMQSDQHIGAIQPKLLDYYHPEKFEYAGGAGGFLDHYGFPFCMGRIFGRVETDEHQYDTNRQLFWATGAALMVRKAAWEAAGGLDEMFFAHMEEIDLCWRLQCLGYQIKNVTDAKVLHMGGGTLSNINPRKTFLNFRNGLYMLHKNLHPTERKKIILRRKLLDGMAGVFFILQFKWKHFLQILKAHKEFEKTKHLLHCTEKPIQMRELKGVLPKSLVFAYFLKNKKTTQQLMSDVQQ